MHKKLIKFIKMPLRKLKLSSEDLKQLLHSSNHSSYLSRHRAQIIIERVRLVAAVFAVLTFFWIGLDYFAFDRQIWEALASMRIVSTCVFICIAWPWKFQEKMSISILMMVVMMLNPLIFYVMANFLFSGRELVGLGGMIAKVYVMLPFIIIAGLSVFPLTALEASIFAIPIIAITVLTSQLIGSGSMMSTLATFWVLMLIFGIYLLAGMGQLSSMISLVHRASKDPLTDLLTRRTGSEVIDLNFHISILHNTPFSVLFLDLDHFKSINDDFGHEAGDEALRNAAKHLHKCLRGSDIITRWGGEEIVAVLPNTNMEGIKLILARIMKDWLGTRPDGKPLTASIGVAERISDNLDDWPELIELADNRMYKAKESGRARAVICGDEIMTTELS